MTRMICTVASCLLATLFGVAALTFMMAMYALEHRGRRFIVAFVNWSNAAVVAATVDFNAVTAKSEPAGAFFAAFSTHAAMPLVYDAHASSASSEKSACASEAI